MNNITLPAPFRYGQIVRDDVGMFFVREAVFNSEGLVGFHRLHAVGPFGDGGCTYDMSQSPVSPAWSCEPVSSEQLRKLSPGVRAHLLSKARGKQLVRLWDTKIDLSRV
jgi:hypothetical protein